MIISDEAVNNIHLQYIARKHCANIEMGDVIELAGTRIHHKSSRTIIRTGDRVYIYVINHSNGWRIHVKVRATNDSYSARIDRQFPAGCIRTFSAVNNWMADVCA